LKNQKMVKEMAHVSPWKEAQVQEIKKLMSDKPVIGLVDIKGIPGPQIQKMRLNLRDRAILRISKIRLLSIALSEMEGKKQGIKNLTESLDGQVALIATNMNPFKLFKVLEESKTKAPAKGGELCSEDIDIKAGETAFKPGPIVGELQRVGIPAAIEQGKVVIKTDKKLVKAGETISRDMAQMLTRLEIFPLTVGLDLKAVFEDGEIFRKTDLDINTQEFVDNLSLGANFAYNLAFNSGYITPFTIIPLLQGASNNAMNLVYNANIITPASVEYMLQKAQTNMFNIASSLRQEALDDELKKKLGSVSKVEAKKPAKAKDKKETAEKKEEKDDKKKKSEATPKKEEEEEVSEEEAASGLSQLFG
jgi:large subunit ribosomal protein L10